MNMAVKQTLKLIHIEVHAIRTLVSAVRCSVKRRDKLDALKRTLSLDGISIPPLDVETRWSFAYELLRKSLRAGPILENI